MEESPSPRCRLSAWEYAGQLWTFGGFGKSPAGYLNNHGDFSLFYGRYGENNQLLCFDPGTQKWVNPQCFGDVPFPRKDHAMALTQDSVCLFGGTVRTRAEHYEFRQLNMNTLTWTQLNASGIRPHGGSQCTMTPLPNNKLVVHGAFINDFQNISTETWILDLTSHTWRQHTSSNHVRLYHTASCNLNNGVIVIGGDRELGSTSVQYNNIFHVMLEPKSLQKLAVEMIYRHQAELPWNSLQKELIAFYLKSLKT